MDSSLKEQFYINEKLRQEIESYRKIETEKEVQIIGFKKELTFLNSELQEYKEKTRIAKEEAIKNKFEYENRDKAKNQLEEAFS